jgi:hypothetical protein
MAPTRRWQVAAVGRGCVKTKTDLAVNQFCKIQTFKSRRFESRLEFLARFARFAKAPSVFTQPRPSVARCSQFPVSTPYRRSLPAAIGLAKWWRVVFLIHCRQLMCKASRSRNINRKITTTASHSRIEFRNWRDGLRAVGVGASAPTGGDLAGSPADVAVTAKAKPIAAPANATTIPAVPDHFPLLYLPRL